MRDGYPPRIVARSTIPGPMETHHTILVVDPDPAIRTLIVALLHREGYATEAAASAEQALELHRKTQPKAVVVEPRIPGGRALLDALRTASGDGDGKAAVIVLTTPDGSRKPFAG